MKPIRGIRVKFALHGLVHNDPSEKHHKKHCVAHLCYFWCRYCCLCCWYSKSFFSFFFLLLLRHHRRLEGLKNTHTLTHRVNRPLKSAAEMTHGMEGNRGNLCRLRVATTVISNLFNMFNTRCLGNSQLAVIYPVKRWAFYKHMSASSELPAFRRSPSSSGAPQRVERLPLHLFAFSCLQGIKAKQRKSRRRDVETRRTCEY